ncbi:hypothetical protein RJ639_044165 [Escallonia herrerae]|uniref:Methyltransferase type 12 domain-containing protein n=1 Tax=Escallonia herrerae TaxID=1293975 RepID=A0AA88WAY9_9ASTE|nr:hypothetical protein RJ639_044165 [Escallonia herrerae]
MKEMLRSIGMSSTNSTKTELVFSTLFATTISVLLASEYSSRIDTTWTRNGDTTFLEREAKSFWSDTIIAEQIGCGAGNTIFPLVATYCNIFVHACDFSPRAVNLVKMHKDFSETRVNAFVCDLTVDDLSKQISPSSVDIVTMIFVLSAVSPEKMPLVLQNIRKVLKPNGYVLFRDYATGDLAQKRLGGKDQKISENFYVRGDGTRAFYFADEFLTRLFKENGFETEEYDVYCKQVENRSREIVMDRRWVQAVFYSNVVNCLNNRKCEVKLDLVHKESENTQKASANGFEIDMSEGVASEMFGVSPSTDETMEVKLSDWVFKIRELSKEYQHTCKSTGLMLWESARLMASIVAANQSIVSGKRVLELGSGCGGICSMVAARSADLVVATDGDETTLELLSLNVSSNLQSSSRSNLITKVLRWGNKDHIGSIKQLSDEGFEIILGTDVTYIPEAISPLFSTARELISVNKDIEEVQKPALILCHILRRVDEPSIISAAAHFGFKLVDRWPLGSSIARSQSIMDAWFLENSEEVCIPSTALSIMYFHTV